MYQTQNHGRKVQSLQKKFMSSIKGVSHLSRWTKRRLYCKRQLWLWRRRRERCRLLMFRGRRPTPGTCDDSASNFSLKPQLQENENVLTNYRKHRETSPVPTSGCLEPLEQDACLNRVVGGRESHDFSGTNEDSSCLQGQDICSSFVADSRITQAAVALLQSPETSVQPREAADPLKRHHPANLLPCADRNCCSESQLETGPPSQPPSPVPPHQDQTAVKGKERAISEASSSVDVHFISLMRDIREFLDGFFRRYGSFIALCRSDLLRHLRRKFSCDFGDWKNLIFSEVSRSQAAILEKPAPLFRVVYKKHIVTLDDLLTLADQNWLNDQVMNMYGELITESSHHKVHFFNSFFHRQLMTKGYDGVKRWTKQVDLFSKSLLLVPIHLEVHWCLVTADIATKTICLYDSQGHVLQKVVRNIVKYLMTEAKEKKQPAFEDGWKLACDEEIPQQTNENDCGVFVLEYSRCLALSRPFQFSQKDIPKIRKRIYKELCDCKLREQD
uniref:SUMO1/sentrin specific peptidase 5 n=1 Tax=Nothobranchius rachovii TaxID=451742 RepID=A0A1A8S2Q8_9TELE